MTSLDVAGASSLPESGQALQRASLARAAFRRYKRNRGAVVALIALIVLTLYAIFVPMLYQGDPYRVDFSQASQPASLEHPFGTDQFGRDLFVRNAYGTRVSLTIALGATLAILIIGVSYGSISGFFGGKTDSLMMRFLDALYGLPYLPFAIITLQIFGHVSIWSMVVALSIASWFTCARIVRGQVLSLKENDYIRAAKAVGAKSSRILTKHLLPNTLGIVIIVIFLELPGVILGEAFLSFIGLGINPPQPSLGSLAQDGLSSYRSHPAMIIIPSMTIAILVMSANFIADGLRDALDPQAREM